MIAFIMIYELFGELSSQLSLISGYLLANKRFLILSVVPKVESSCLSSSSTRGTGPRSGAKRGGLALARLHQKVVQLVTFA